MDNDAQPLFRQIAVLIENAIVEGSLLEEHRAPSTNELATFHNINPATARKGLTLLVERGVLEKRRGLGMFVTSNAVARIRERRERNFAGEYAAPLVDEALRLGYTRKQLHELLDQVAESRGFYS